MNARSTKAANTPYEAELRKQLDPARLPRHVAIILDGNGRWAATRFMPRIFGHQQGAKAVREVVTLSRELGIETLSLYAFSNENWKRPKDEVAALMELLKKYLHGEIATMMENQIRFRAIGQIDRLPEAVVQLIRSVEAQTAEHRGMTLVLALSYGGRTEIIDATRRIAEAVQKGEVAPDQIDETLFSFHLYAPDLPDPDLLIRTSGEVRISNFYLWEAAYTELYFTDTLWPNFGRCDFLSALLDYQKRERRFGHVHSVPPEAQGKRAR